MRVLVLGTGSREHALIRKIEESPHNTGLFCLSGNPMMDILVSRGGESISVSLDHLEGVVSAAGDKQIDLTVVGPPAPLCAGIVDRFAAAGLRCFGPTADAAKIECDKAFAKQLMRQAAVPTPETRVFDEFRAARQYIASRDYAVVVKAGGLTDSQGVFICEDPADGILAAEQIMKERAFGSAGRTVVVEERLQGVQVSVPALVDGRTIYVLEPVQVYRRLDDGDQGPITAGMGAVCPMPAAGEQVLSAVEEEVLLPIVDALNRAGTPYRGVLSTDLMLTPGGPKVLGFHCGFGDPQAPALLPRWQGDLLEAIDQCSRGQLEDAEIAWDRRAAVCIVLTTEKQPESYAGGAIIRGLDAVQSTQEVMIFHAGTRVDEETDLDKTCFLTAGRRVLVVTALGETPAEARQRAYAAVERIHFDGMHYRKDIAAGAGDER